MEHAPSWLISSLIYLSAAVVAVPVAKALGLGSIIGYLIAGVVIGPWGIGWVTNVQDILHFAEFGVVLMLFLVGLELEPKRLWSLRTPIFGWGTAQVVACALALFVTGWGFGVEWKVALVASLGLALSSTAVALQVMNERNLMRTSSGQAGFSVLLFQDVAAIPILAMLPVLAAAVAPSLNPSNASANGHWIVALQPVAAIGALILAGRVLLRPLLRWIASSKTPEIFTATALLLVVAIAALMQLIGLSMALGAFLAGVLLADSEYRRELETDIEPFKGLLLGLFFIAVGMGIDFGVVLAAPERIAIIVLGFLSVKAMVIFALTRWMELPFQERPILIVLLAQGGEFAFVVFQTAAGVRLIDAQTTSLLIAAVAISMLVSPLLLMSIDKWLLPQFANCNTTRPEEINEPQDAPVIIAGFGRYGQIVGRVMGAHGVRCTVLDHDAQMIDAARQFGYRVFYGDATRLDLLKVAGAQSAKVLVVAVDTQEESLEIVDLARSHFAHLKLVVRVRDIEHAYAMLDRGALNFERELFQASLSSAQTVLQALGNSPDVSKNVIDRFKHHNIALMHEMHEHHKDRGKMISIAKRGRANLEQQMAAERDATRISIGDSDSSR